MGNFFDTLEQRHALLFYFGLAYLVGAAFCLVMRLLTRRQVLGVNAYIKPFKFFLSSAILSFTLAWYVGYLGQRADLWILVPLILAVLCFQDVYILLQAARGQQSHFNGSTPFYSRMFSLMALTSFALTMAVLYLGFVFWTSDFPQLPLYYVWSIRIGLVLFVVFALQGFVMGARMAHTVGAPDGSPGLPVVNWSRRFGDLRIAHFLGMHALQILPLLSFYVLRNTTATIAAGLLYGALTIGIHVHALKGRPLLPGLR